MHRHLALIVFFLFSSLAHAQDFATADKELNAVYKKIVHQYADDPVFLGKLKLAQQAWLKFRDAQLEARFPGPDQRENYGSVYSLCADSILTELTEARSRQLRLWLEGFEEGEVCFGSVKNKIYLEKEK